MRTDLSDHHVPAYLRLYLSFYAYLLYLCVYAYIPYLCVLSMGVWLPAPPTVNMSKTSNVKEREHVKERVCERHPMSKRESAIDKANVKESAIHNARGG